MPYVHLCILLLILIDLPLLEVLHLLRRGVRRENITHTCMWHHGEGRLRRVDRRAHDIHSFRTDQHYDQSQVEFFEELQLYVPLAVPHQRGSQKIRSARANHEVVGRSSLTHGLLK
jgi:hypothetical protein